MEMRLSSVSYTHQTTGRLTKRVGERLSEILGDGEEEEEPCSCLFYWAPHHRCPYLKTATLAWLRWHGIQMWADMNHWLISCRSISRWNFFPFELHDVTCCTESKEAASFQSRELHKETKAILQQHDSLLFPDVFLRYAMSVSIWTLKPFLPFIVLALLQHTAFETMPLEVSLLAFSFEVV